MRNQQGQTVITAARISEDLARLGLATGDWVVLHSSLRSIGQVEGGADSVVTALLDVLGPAGLLMAPSYTYWTQRFDVANARGATGAISEAIRRRSGAVRSWHPTHSVVAIGSDAEAICAGHHSIGAVEVDSPLGKVARNGGFVLLLGAGHASNSTVHVGENAAKVPYLDVKFRADSFTTATVLLPDREIDVPIIHPSGCSRSFGRIEEPLRARGAVRDGLVGGAVSQLMRGQAVIDTAVDRLSADTGWLLCTDPNCYRCVQARFANRSQGAS
jgi:aminoglycoside 3-N-acetyltransferase